MTFATDMEYNITYLFTSYQLTFKMHKTRYFLHTFIYLYVPMYVFYVMSCV